MALTKEKNSAAGQSRNKDYTRWVKGLTCVSLRLSSNSAILGRDGPEFKNQDLRSAAGILGCRL